MNEVVKMPDVQRCPACLDPGSPCRCSMDYLHCQAELYANWLRWCERWTPTPEMRGEEVAA